MYILDTCAFIWSVLDDPKLSGTVKASLWEIAIKKTTGKLNLRHNTFELEER